MLDYDLAEIYGYEVKRLNEQVKRNITRFPEDFMFQLTKDEIPEDFLKSQIATLNENGNKRGLHIKKLPYAFTEQGIYMLATILRGDLAEQQSIFIMRAFREMRHYEKQLRCYSYTRVYTSMQVDSYSLDAQKDKLHKNVRKTIYFDYRWCYNSCYQNGNKNERRRIIKFGNADTV